MTTAFGRIKERTPVENVQRYLHLLSRRESSGNVKGLRDPNKQNQCKNFFSQIKSFPSLSVAAVARIMSDLGVRANMDPTQWHGAYDCKDCGRKRLPAVEFSNKMVQRARAGDKVSCKKCAAERLERERLVAEAKRSDASEGTSSSTHVCAACGATKPASAFSRAQLNNKGADARCSACVRDAEACDAKDAKESVEKRLKEARAASAVAEATNAMGKLGVFAREAALEAELVTGLKPQRIGGRGRGGRGRGRSNPNSMLGRGGKK